MPKTTDKQHDNLFLQELSKKLQVHLKVEVREFKDCRAISLKMARAGCDVSAHTFARFFGLMPSKNRPYTYTLDVICQFIGFDSYAAFCQYVQSNTQNSLAGPSNIFSSGSYSLVALEIALANEDFETVKEILRACDFTSRYHVEISMVLGKAVRNSTNRDFLLNMLIEMPEGQMLFYETFVDEDDPEGYYSKALQKYYLQHPATKHKIIFPTCYLGAKTIYFNRKLNEFPSVDFFKSQFEGQELHFHEKSRLLEVIILLDFEQGKLNASLPGYIQQLVSNCTFHQDWERAWLLARFIKALSFCGYLKKAYQDDSFRRLLEKIFHANSRIQSVADLIIQYAYHGLNKAKMKKGVFYPPQKINALHDNETNARIVIESATSLLYAENNVKNWLEKNVHSFAIKTGNTWVFDLLK